MASNIKHSVASALNSLSGDGIFFPIADEQNVEALIEDYFNESKESGSDDDEECSKEFITYITRTHSNLTHIIITGISFTFCDEINNEEIEGKCTCCINQ